MTDYSPNFTISPEEEPTSETKYEKKLPPAQNDATFKYEGESKLVGMIIKISGGMIQDEEQANYVLIGLAILVILASAIIVMAV